MVKFNHFASYILRGGPLEFIKDYLEGAEKMAGLF